MLDMTSSLSFLNKRSNAREQQLAETIKCNDGHVHTTIQGSHSEGCASLRCSLVVSMYVHITHVQAEDEWEHRQLQLKR